MNEADETYTERARELAEAHWAYIRGLLVAHGVELSAIRIAAYHYLTVFEHGYKHAIEDVEEGVYSEGGLGGK